MYFNTITDYLHDTFNLFLEEIDGMSSLCDLRNVSFESGKLPDYTNRAQALLYCLRYHFGYAFEYEYIYRNHILNSFDSDQINVLSIGCGNGIDLWALDHAIQKSGSQIRHINYMGVDRVDWKEYFDCSLDNHVKYIQCEITELQEEFENIDVLILPKSISELRQEDLVHLADIIDQCTNELYVVASFREESYNINVDSKMFAGLIAMLEYNGFEISEGHPKDICSIAESRGILSISDDYKYPDDVKNYLLNLSSVCLEKAEDDAECQILCPQKLSRSPILRTDHIRYNIVKIRRR